MRISDWSSDVCSSDLATGDDDFAPRDVLLRLAIAHQLRGNGAALLETDALHRRVRDHDQIRSRANRIEARGRPILAAYVQDVACCLADSTEERRVGKECGSTFTSTVVPVY